MAATCSFLPPVVVSTSPQRWEPLATSLVADLQLIAAALVWGYASYVGTDGLTREATASVVSLSGGALLANVVSVVLLVVETVSFHRR